MKLLICLVLKKHSFISMYELLYIVVHLFDQKIHDFVVLYWLLNKGFSNEGELIVTLNSFNFILSFSLKNNK